MLLIKWKKSYAHWFSLLLLCVLLQSLNLTETMRFDRDAISQGNVWLLLTGNLLHHNWSHLLLNMAGLALVAIFFGSYMSVLTWIALSLWSALIVGLGLFYFNPDVFWYVGMSGVLHGLFVVGGWYEFRRFKVSGFVLLALIVTKLIWEQLSGAMAGSENLIGGKIVTDAHLYGGIAGVVFLVVRLKLLQWANQKAL